MDDQRLECPKEWFKSNIKGILKLYGREHSLQKEDVYLGKCVAGIRGRRQIEEMYVYSDWHLVCSRTCSLRKPQSPRWTGMTYS